MLCLLALFPFGIGLLVLLARPPLGSFLFLVVLLIWLLLMMVLGERILLLVFARRFAGFVVLVLDGKEFDLTEKIPAHLAGLVVQSRHVFGRDCIQLGTLTFSLPDRKRRRCGQDDQENVPAQVRTGVE